jgi:uncharacterized protein (UPF0276 family)
MERKILLTECPDSKGLIAQITNICYKHQLNIIRNTEYVDPVSGQFYMRTELEGVFNDQTLLFDLDRALPKGSQRSLVSQSAKRVVILVTKEAHCLGDILIKVFDGSLALDIAAVVGNYPELEQLAALCDRYAPAMVSDHLSWSGSASNRYPDLLPVPYTAEVLDHFAVQVARVQDRLGRTMLIENPSRYLAFRGDTMHEAEFLHALCARTGCGLLLDINNIEVTATNCGLDTDAMIHAIDPALVGEIHLAGHAAEQHPHGPLLIDDHGSQVSDETWRLFARFIDRAGPLPVLIEWDINVPEFDVLLTEAGVAGAIMNRAARGRHALRGQPYALA